MEISRVPLSLESKRVETEKRWLRSLWDLTFQDFLECPYMERMVISSHSGSIKLMKLIRKEVRQVEFSSLIPRANCKAKTEMYSGTTDPFKC